MPANIDSLAFVGETPWHGLGTRVDLAMTAAEAIEAGGLTWQVSEWPLLVGGREVQTHKALMRSDKPVILGIVGKRYTPIQNDEAFTFFDAVTTTATAKYHTVGSLNEGRQIWLLAKLPGEIVVTKDDVTEKFVLLVNSHDGSRALLMQWTPIRVVCQNTLNIALGQAAERFYTKHTRHVQDRMVARVGQAQELLGIGNRFYQQFEETAKRLATLALPAPRIEEMTRELLALQPGIPAETFHIFKRRAYEKVLELVEVGRGQTAEVRGTAWGWFNAVAEYSDFHMPTRRRVEGAKLQSAWFGYGAKMKRKAWELVTR